MEEYGAIVKNRPPDTDFAVWICFGMGQSTYESGGCFLMGVEFLRHIEFDFERLAGMEQK